MDAVVAGTDLVPLPAYRAAEMRVLDGRLMAREGIDGYALMCRAGRAAFFRLRRLWPQARCIGVVCGPGSNGGDGYVIAGLARAWGMSVQLWGLVPVSDLRGDAQRAAADFVAGGGRVLSLEPAALRAAEVEVWVDALFGTGLVRPLTGAVREAIAVLNDHPAPVLAIDVPSGLSADTGAVLGAAVQAAATVSFIAAKPGLYTGAGPDCCGEVMLDRLDAPVDLGMDLSAACTLWPDTAPLGALLPPRAPATHKGHFGHVLVVGGGAGMPGAARMAAEAALRVGAGLVSVATAPAHSATLGIGRPELMVASADSSVDLAPLLARSTVQALGPGLGRGAWAQRMFAATLAVPGPLVIDADGLNVLAEAPCRRADWILTPHPAEAGRLLGCTTAEIQADRLAAARALTDRYGGVVVLKGAGTLVDDGREVALCAGANPGLASGGMGDVLTGLIAGLLAQGLAPFAAARAGVRLHLRAGALAARAVGMPGMLASDVIAQIAPALAEPGRPA
jgi:NAD(P)H-hydrate epimerase